MDKPQQKLKIAAVSNTRVYDWRVLVEMDVATLRALDKTAPFDAERPPSIGTEIDLTPTFDRLIELESRERDVRQLLFLLAKLNPPAIAPQVT